MKLLIAIPTVDYIHYSFVESLTKLVSHLKDKNVDFEVFFQADTLIYTARNQITDKAIRGGFTHVLWLDSDIVFDEFLFDKMYETNKSFVTCIIHGRRPPHRPCIFKTLAPAKRYESPDEYPSSVFEVGACGFGCVLTETNVLLDVKIHSSSPFMPTPDLGEDLAFCERATKLGYKIFAEPSIKIGHIGHIPIYPEDMRPPNLA